MAITPVNKDMSIVSKLSALPNATDGLTYQEFQAKFDEGGLALKNYINNTLIPALQSVTDNSSGADQIGATTIESLDGATVQAILESIRNKLKSTVDSSSGADFVGATGISGVNGNTVQSLIEGLKVYVDSNFDTADEITNNRKLDETGNFTGSWFGFDKPSASEPGIQAQVDSNTAQLAETMKKTPWSSNNNFTGEDIQSLIDNATNGDTIILQPGTYSVSSQISWSDKELHILALGNVVLVEEILLNVPIIEITNASNSSIKGLTCSGAETYEGFYGEDAKHYSFIKVNSSDNVSLEDLKVTDKTYGIILSYCTNTKINKLHCVGFLQTGSIGENGTNYSSGVRVYAGKSNSINGVYCKDMGSGVLLGYAGTRHKVFDVFCENMRDNGIYISSGTDNIISHVTVNGAIACGIKARGSRHIVSNNNLYNCSDMGVSLTGDGTTLDQYGYNGHGTICEGNVVEDCGNLGISIAFQDGYYPRDFKVLNNEIINSGSGVNAAIRVLRGMGHHITGNTVDGFNGDYGIYVEGIDKDLAKRHKISNNTIRNGKTGIRMTYVDKSLVEGNDFESLTARGIEGRFVTETQITKNKYPNGYVVDIGSSTYPSTGNSVTENEGSDIGISYNNRRSNNVPEIKNYVISVGSAPYHIGQKALVNGVLYEATGISSSTDWKQISA